jgi:hypothetical protein
MRVAHLTALSLSALAVAATGTALAGDGAHPAQPAGPAAAALAPIAGKTASPAALAALPAGLPKKYRSLSSDLLVAPNGDQTRGTVDCPTGTVPLGGGVLISSSDLHANVNSSFPNGNSWFADVNNASGAATTFRVFVICAKAPRLYQVVQTADVSGPAGSQAQAIATCPTGTVPYGGGAISRTGDAKVNMNSTFPTGNGWRTDMNNASTFAENFASFAICGKKLKGYTVVQGSNSDVPAHLSVGSTPAVCPGASLPLGGGVVAFSSDVHANINATFPSSSDAWNSFLNNDSAFTFAQSARVVCAGI